ncbi:MAG TPA: hypothetical protein VM183_06640 [Burkholderiales bacterium]|nr:hypothetical protein [Burkholderiales bacterium]
MKRQAVLFLALLCHAVPVIPQDMRFPVQIAQPAQAPEPTPPPTQPPPKPTTATPPEDTGIAGQVAQGVVLPAVGAVSTAAIVAGILGVAAAAALVGASSDENATPAAATTGTR